MTRIITLLFAAVSCLPLGAFAESAQSILETARQRQLERWNGVDSYLVEQTMAGQRSTTIFERIEAKGPDGKAYTKFRPYRGSASGTGPGPGGRKLTPEELEIFADATEMTGEAQAKGIEDGLEQAGLPRGLLAASGSDPTATFDPRVMMGANATFLRGAADAERANAAEKLRDAAEADPMAEFASRARLVGTEQVDGRSAFHLRVEDLNQVQQVDGEQFTLQSASLWLDSKEYVPLRTRTEGVATADGESREFTIERHDSDYRSVAGSRMYEPFRQVVRIAGVMNAEQQAQMREAQAQMADMEQQLAGMPAAQRQMVMNQMGPQMQMMKSMAAGGGFETVIEVHRMIANPTAAQLSPSGAAAVAAVPAASSAAAQAVSVAPAAPMASQAAASAPAGNDGVSRDAEALQREQQACLQAKVDKAQAAQKTKRGFGSLLNAASRVAGMMGSQDLAKTAGDVYSANATAEDLSSAARDLGLTEDDIESCKNPG
jgi:hypothetical protein